MCVQNICSIYDLVWTYADECKQCTIVTTSHGGNELSCRISKSNKLITFLCPYFYVQIHVQKLCELKLSAIHYTKNILYTDTDNMNSVDESMRERAVGGSHGKNNYGSSWYTAVISAKWYMLRYTYVAQKNFSNNGHSATLCKTKRSIPFVS